MSKVNDLIQKLCPNGVKFDKLENITLLQAGDRITTAMMSDDYDFDTLIDVGRNGLTRLSFTASVNDNDDDFLE